MNGEPTPDFPLLYIEIEYIYHIYRILLQYKT